MSHSRRPVFPSSLSLIALSACLWLPGSASATESEYYRAKVKEQLNAYRYCTDPERELSPGEASWCTEASHSSCPGFQEACRRAAKPAEKPSRWWLAFWPKVLEFLAIVLLGALGAFGLWHLGRWLHGARRLPKERASVAPEPQRLPTVLLHAGPKEAEQQFALGEEAERDGRFDDAIRAFHQAMIWGLAERRLLTPAHWQTRGDQLRDLGPHAAAEELRPVTQRLDRIDFNHEPAAAPHAADARSRARRLLALLATSALLLSGCDQGLGQRFHKTTEGPGGFSLFQDVLRSDGAHVTKRFRPLLGLAKERVQFVVVLRPLATAEATELQSWLDNGGRVLVTTEEPALTDYEWTAPSDSDAEDAAPEDSAEVGDSADVATGESSSETGAPNTDDSAAHAADSADQGLEQTRTDAVAVGQGGAAAMHSGAAREASATDTVAPAAASAEESATSAAPEPLTADEVPPSSSPRAEPSPVPSATVEPAMEPQPPTVAAEAATCVAPTLSTIGQGRLPGEHFRKPEETHKLAPRPDDRWLLHCGQEAHWLERPAGRGLLLLASGRDWFRNAHFAAADNGVATTAWLHEQGEEIHVVGPWTASSPPSARPLASVPPSQLAPVMFHALLWLLAGACLLGWHFGAPVDDVWNRRRSFVEHVTAVGRGYQAIQAASLAYHFYARWALAQLRTRMGARRGLDDLATRVALATGRDETSVLRLLAHAAAAAEHRPQDGDRSLEPLARLRDLHRLMKDTLP